jgi:acyl dehydratase
MPTTADALMRHAVPEGRQELTPRDAILYALSVGVGHDPLDPAQLAFLDERNLRVLPAMAAVLATPGFWLGDPATGIDALRLVHGEQGIRLHAKLPTHGTLISRTRIIGIEDKGAGKGALLFTARDVIDHATGTVLATNRVTTFLRGDGGMGSAGERPKPLPNVPERAPDAVLDLATRPEQALIYRLNGDWNPLHLDPEVAARAGFPRPILHGLCTFGVVCHALLRLCCGGDPARLRAMSLRFTAPVFPGETIRTEVWHAERAFRARAAERDVVVAGNGVMEVA